MSVQVQVLVFVLGVIIGGQAVVIAKLRKRLRDANWRLPAHDAFHGDIFNGRNNRNDSQYE